MSNPSTHSHYLPIATGLGRGTGSGLDGAPRPDATSATALLSSAPRQLPTANSAKRRKPSRARGSKPLSKSHPTPEARDAAMSDSDSDKKRNKLGYQRISIACANNDSQQRCQNCIRLKKECVFHPVDQPGAVENRSESSGGKLGTGSGPSSVVSSSPPNQGGQSIFESTHEFAAFPTVPSNAPSTYEGLYVESSSAHTVQGSMRYAAPANLVGPDRRAGGFVHAVDDYRASHESRAWSTSATLDASASGLQPGHNDAMPQMFSRYINHSGLNADYAPFPASDPMHAQDQFQNAQGFAYAQHNDRIAWQQQQQQQQHQQQQLHQPGPRSVSYGQLDHLQQAHATAYPPVFHTHPHSQPLTNQYPLPPLHTQTAVPLPRDAHASRSAPARPAGPHALYPSPFMFQPLPDPAGAGPPPHLGAQQQPQHAYAPTGWYPDPVGYESVSEEPEGYEGTESRPG
ncbi:hypothetical protein LTR53_009608 [Teratosphaeriaceae sp. CCFEE 6253]|nr:hypothetical protein LTR53_009608 [Teratosphaeriaceae sp. CCFEE 6253]